MQQGMEEYLIALKQGQREYNELIAAHKDPNPAVLDEVLPEGGTESIQELGILEIPSNRIVGTKSAGRIAAFTPSFRPLLETHSEFAVKWMQLCEAHLGITGIRDPILCYEYLGNFYVQEGNKRVSVLRHFDAPRIPAQVRRIIPPKSDDPRIQAYYEFLDFYKGAKLYAVQFRRPRDYGKLLTFLGKKPGEVWTEAERRTFNAYFQYFRDAFDALNTGKADVLPEEALLLWLQVHPYEDLGRLTTEQLRKSLAVIRDDVIASVHVEEALKVQEKLTDVHKPGILTRIIAPSFIRAAFVHQLTPDVSGWALGHEAGREYMQNALGDDRVESRSYFGADTVEKAEALIDQAVADGANVVFTTAPLLSRATLKAALKYPKVEFLNCSVSQAYSSIRTYYGRVYEGKFITGAIAGAMAQNDRIGYIGSYPIFGVPASINAFALGAQLTNPRAQIELRWSCTPGTPQADFFADGIRVISNRDVPVHSRMYLDFCSYGTYLMDDRGGLVPLASPVWSWGKFYETVVRKLLAGDWKNEKTGSQALNYWLGMDSGAVTIDLSDKLPEGMKTLAVLLQQGLSNGSIDPFRRKIVAQDGRIINDGSRTLTKEELLKADWLCGNITGTIPGYEELLPMAQPMVRELGIYRDDIPNG